MKYIILLTSTLLLGCSTTNQTIKSAENAAQYEFQYQLNQTIRNAIEDGFDEIRD